MSILKELFSSLLVILVLGMGIALFMGNRMLNSSHQALASANETITTLQTANDQQASELKELQLQEQGLRQLLGHQNDELAKLDKQNRKTADELQQALDTPPAGRPDCAREPLPSGALRLLQPTGAAGGDHSGGQETAPRGAGTALPGA